MAKYPHRVFEMYDFRDEAIRALTPKADNPATEAIDSESWDFELLAASQAAGMTHVAFMQAQTVGDDAASDLRKDFAQLSNKLSIGSKTPNLD